MRSKKLRIITVGKNSGKSKSMNCSNGLRRKDEETGEDLAPRSIRRKGRGLFKGRKGKRFLKDCSDRELEKAGIKK